MEITDTQGNIMAEWDKYAKMNTVGVFKLGASRYRYEYRGNCS
ncbi:hypothetical protein IKC_01944 [Bacillus cereus VD184]|uniref:Uncharacterized protein n=1 Tax=Bacillus cereus VD184 TaxID=1053242 RepID=A0A9W5VU73_BACCE|nr:hypothetical protein IKC_01944 [Bacillus cereus VD184]